MGRLTDGVLVDDPGDPPEGDARAEERQAACGTNAPQRTGMISNQPLLRTNDSLLERLWNKKRFNSLTAAGVGAAVAEAGGPLADRRVPLRGEGVGHGDATLLHLERRRTRPVTVRAQEPRAREGGNCCA
jgi:hypothetical protein